MERGRSRWSPTARSNAPYPPAINPTTGRAVALAELASQLVEREMCGAFRLDPPLAVDIGVGKDWLDAK